MFLGTPSVHARSHHNDRLRCNRYKSPHDCLYMPFTSLLGGSWILLGTPSVHAGLHQNDRSRYSNYETLVSLLLVDKSPHDCFYMPLASLLDCSWTPLVAMVILLRLSTYLTLVRPCKTEGTLSIFSKKNIKKPLHVCKFHQ